MKTYYTNKTGFIEFFLSDKNEPSYADYTGPNGEVTVFYSEKTSDILGYAIENINHLVFIDLSLEDKLAIFVNRLRKIKKMNQKDFVNFLNKEAGENFISFRNYQRIESSDNSGSIGMHFLSNLSRIFPSENWSILFSSQNNEMSA